MPVLETGDKAKYTATKGSDPSIIVALEMICDGNFTSSVLETATKIAIPQLPR
jgi:hypothetical protein